MTGLERNADIVHMCSYAPLFAHVDAWQWRPDLIWFDNLHVVGTPNYYVQKLYSTHAGTHVIPITVNNEALIGQHNLYASSTIDKNKKIIYIKLVNASSEIVPVIINLKGNSSLKEAGVVKVLSSADLTAYNSIENPENVVPEEKSVEIIDNELNYSLDTQSFSVFVVYME